jgi:transposase
MLLRKHQCTSADYKSTGYSNTPKKWQQGCPAIQRLSHNSIIKQLSDTFICFQLHINIMAFIRRLRNQNWLFHPTIADLIEEDHICRLVDDVVDSIDFKSIEGRYDGPGSPAYHPKVMMKLLIPSGMHST